MTGAPAAGHDDVTARLDLRLAAPALAAWGGAWWATAASPAAGLTAAAASALVAGLLALPPVRGRDQRQVLPVVAAVLVCAAAGCASAGVRAAALHAGPVPALAEQAARGTASLVLTGDPRVRPPSPEVQRTREVVLVTARLQHLSVEGREVETGVPVLVIALDEEWAGWLPGQRLEASVRLAAAERGARHAAVLFADAPPRPVAHPGAVQRAAGELRAGLRDAVGGLPPGPRGLVPGLVVGDESLMLPELDEDFRTTGLTHLTAVSGANVMIVLGFVLLVARWAGLRGRWLPALGLLALAGFLVLARPQPSVVRATAMGVVAVAGLATGRRRLGPAALGAAVLGLVLLDPWLARSYGFVLSALATAALLLLAPGWTRVLSAVLPLPLAAAVAVPAAAQAVCAPVVVLLSEEVSLVAVPANLLVAPAIAPATILGVAAAVVAPVLPPLASLLGGLAGLPAAWIVLVARAGAEVPGAAVPWPGTGLGALGLALLTGFVVAAAGVLARRLPSLDRLPHPPHVRMPRRVPLARRSCLGVVLALAVLVTGAVAGPLAREVPVRLPVRWPPPDWVLVACDVGQGDALALHAGPGAAVVVDAGPDRWSVDRCLRDLGVSHVPVLVLTHLHADHVGGVEGVLAERRVGQVVIGPLDEPSEQARRLAGVLGESGVTVRRARVGERSTDGPLTWQVLGPSQVLREGSAPNNASLQVLAESSGVRMLLTGDVEPPAQRALLRLLDGDADGDVDSGPVDVLKVPHHGSALQLPSLFATVAPRVAVVPVGEGNDYGHPAPSTLALLETARLLRTDLDGDVAVVGPRERLGVVRRGR